MMKGTPTVAGIGCVLVAAALAVCLAVEHRSSLRLGEENNALRRQLSRMDQSLAGNQRPSDRVARTNASPSLSKELAEAPSVTDEKAKELVRLRGEVEALRRQAKEMDTLRADTRRVRAQETALSKPHAERGATDVNAAAGNDGQLEIVSAVYGTDRTNMDVTAKLTDRIRDGHLRAIASNNINGDPDFGHVKRLTVVYRFDGRTVTNVFRENDYVALPPERGENSQATQH